MSIHHFTVVLRDAPELTEELSDKLFAAGCGDGSPAMFSGQTMIDFHREAASLEDAIRSVLANISSAGCFADRVVIEAEHLPAS